TVMSDEPLFQRQKLPGGISGSYFVIVTRAPSAHVFSVRNWVKMPCFAASALAAGMI
ncbi:hypothetical protein LCGC14_2274790, partial [marine sediment metagenome]